MSAKLQSSASKAEFCCTVRASALPPQTSSHCPWPMQPPPSPGPPAAQCRYPPVWFPALLPSSAPQDLKKPAQAVTCQPSPWPSLGPPNLRPPNLLSSQHQPCTKAHLYPLEKGRTPGLDVTEEAAMPDSSLSPCVSQFLRTILEVCCIVLVSSSCAVLPSFVLLFSAVSMSCSPPCLLPAQHPMPCQSYSSMPGLMLLDSCDKHHQFWLFFFFLQCCFSFFTLLFMLGSSFCKYQDSPTASF